MVRYKYFGPSISCTGKTLWEILGNLKNFGVGRLLVKSNTLNFPEPSFIKILQVQPLEQPLKKYCNRNVIVWMEEVYRGKKIKNILKVKKNFLPNFMLVPKWEEEKYYELEEKYKNIETDEIIPNFIKCPPLYEELYKNKLKYFENNLPQIKTILSDNIYSKTRLDEKGNSVMPKQYSNLYKENVSVEEIIKKIVELQKIVNSHKLEENLKN